MASQSGIVPQTTFISAAIGSLSEYKAVVVEIDNNLQLILNEELFADNLDILSQRLDRYAHCVYILMKDAFVSYIPDEAPVRSKMLYASTKNTLLRALPPVEHVVFVSNPDEISTAGWEKYLESTKADNSHIMTESELSLLKVKDVERVEQFKPRSLAQHANNGLMLVVDDTNIKEMLTIKKLVDGTLVTLKIDGETLKLDELKSDIAVDKLIQSLDDTCPLYHIYVNNEQYYFIYTCPSGSKVRDRMVYAANKGPLLSEFKKWGLNFKETFEIGDPSELEISALSKPESTNIVTNNKNGLRFSKPKGPRKK